MKIEAIHPGVAGRTQEGGTKRAGKFLDDVALVVGAETGDATFAVGLEPLADALVVNMPLNEFFSQLHVKYASKAPCAQRRFYDGDVVFADDCPRPVTAADRDDGKRYGHVFAASRH